MGETNDEPICCSGCGKPLDLIATAPGHLVFCSDCADTALRCLRRVVPPKGGYLGPDGREMTLAEIEGMMREGKAYGEGTIENGPSRDGVTGELCCSRCGKALDLIAPPWGCLLVCPGCGETVLRKVALPAGGADYRPLSVFDLDSGWIPVTSSTPQDGTEVLVALKSKRIEIAMRCGDEWASRARWLLYGVTDWMPLPFPPAWKPEQLLGRPIVRIGTDPWKIAEGAGKHEQPEGLDDLMVKMRDLLTSSTNFTINWSRSLAEVPLANVFTTAWAEWKPTGQWVICIKGNVANPSSKAEPLPEPVERDVDAIPCTCGGYCDSAPCTEDECRAHGCAVDAPGVECCAAAFVCRICGQRYAGSLPAPDMDNF